MRRTTLQTIADELGVSRATVSNAFSRPDQLSTVLRDRILAHAAAVGYAGPNPVAASLRSGRVGAIGVLLTESLRYALLDPWATGFLGGIADVLADAHTGMLLIPLPPSAAVDPVARAAVDGLIALTLPDGHPALDVAVKRQLRVVTVDGPIIDGMPWVGIDDEAAGTAVGTLVGDLGHREVAILSSRTTTDDATGVDRPADLDQIGYTGTRRRLHGMNRGLARHTDARRIPVVDVGPNQEETVRATVAQLLAQQVAPTALICLSDRIALAAIDQVHAHGLRVPEDVSVTGFDDLPDAEPAGLTTIRQPCYDKGAVAANLLAGNDDARVVLPHDLLIRTSVSPPP